MTATGWVNATRSARAARVQADHGGAAAAGGATFGERGGDLVHRGLHGESGREDRGQGLRIDVHVNQACGGAGTLEPLVAAGLHVTERGAEREDQIRAPQTLDQRGRRAEAELARVTVVAVRKMILAAKAGDDRQVPAFREDAQRIDAGRRPLAAADPDERAPGRAQAVGDFTHGFGRHTADETAPGRAECLRAVLAEHVFGQADDHGSRASRHRELEGAVDDFPGARGDVDLQYAFREIRERHRQIDFLERAPEPILARNLADEQHHRRRVLVCRVHADARVRKPRAARDEGDAAASAELADGFGHVRRRRLVAAGDDLDRIARIVERIQDVQITLARDREHVGNLLCAQAVDDRIGYTVRAHRAAAARSFSLELTTTRTSND